MKINSGSRVGVGKLRAYLRAEGRDDLAAQFVRLQKRRRTAAHPHIAGAGLALLNALDALRHSATWDIFFGDRAKLVDVKQLGAASGEAVTFVDRLAAVENAVAQQWLRLERMLQKEAAPENSVSAGMALFSAPSAPCAEDPIGDHTSSMVPERSMGVGI